MPDPSNVSDISKGETGTMPKRDHSVRAENARRVRAARGWANLTQPELAAKLNISVASVRRIEQERRDVSTAELVTISEVCTVPRSFMLHGWSESATDTLDNIIADMSKRIEHHEKLHRATHEQLKQLAHGEVPDLVTELENGLSAESPRRHRQAS